ncbi:MAG TPA: prepilin peptidase [Candidatus Paceibacterota bacterium]|nr:prepilin peptidase [Candidatus Paceibacterota bacterium]
MEILLTISFATLGAVVASFAAVVAERHHTGESWLNDRSRCNSCDEPLRSFDMVPVASYALSLGRARCCGARVPWLYPAVEVTLASLFALAYGALGFVPALAPFLLALGLLAFIVLYDLRHTVVPTAASNLFVLSALAYAYLAAPGLAAFAPTLIVAGIIGLLFYAMHAFSKGRAMGLGDSPIALGLSLLVGMSAVPGLLFSFWIGALCAVFILVRTPAGHRMGIEVPFVPFLAAGYLLAFFTQWNPLPF